jgi:hypothetical protein
MRSRSMVLANLWPVVMLLVVAQTTGCQKYKADPLQPDEVFRTLAPDVGCTAPA